MGVVNIIKNVKQIHPNDIALVKVGKFYHSYGRDAYIVSFLFDYQLKKVEQNTNATGFPEAALNKVKKVLEDQSINYLVVDRSANYEVVDEYNVKNKNEYVNVYNKAHKYISRKNKIDAIYEYLLNNIDDDIIKDQVQKIEEMLYERG